MHNLAIVTTCKGRLAALKHTLPLMLRVNAQVVVVDYDCPDGAADWIEANHPEVKVVRVCNNPSFNMADARNRGVEAADAVWVNLIDADVMVESASFDKFFKLVMLGMDQRWYYTVKKPAGCLNGTFLCRKEHYDAVGGSDVAINRYGAGYDEIELYHRFQRFSLEEQIFPETVNPCEQRLFVHLPHEDRSIFYPIKHRKISDDINFLYYYIKADILRHVMATNLTRDECIALMQGVYDTVVASLKSWSPQPLNCALGVIPQGMRVSREMTYTIDARDMAGRHSVTPGLLKSIVCTSE
jgi:glycosyltransferase involved in cell wall biosynthesis